MTARHASSDFVIEYWSKLMRKTGEKVSSGEILELGGVGWSLDVYPQGVDASRQFVIAKLNCLLNKGMKETCRPQSYRVEAAVMVKADPCTRMADSTTVAQDVVTPANPTLVFHLRDPWYEHWVPLQVTNYLDNDRMKITVSVCIWDEELQGTRHPSAIQRMQQPSCHLGQLLTNMRRSGAHCDVDIHASGESLHAHSVVLIARSPVFAAMLQANMTEGATGVIEVTDVDAVTFSRMLDYMYTDCIKDVNFESDAEAVGLLLQASAKYELTGLVALGSYALNPHGTFVGAGSGKFGGVGCTEFGGVARRLHILHSCVGRGLP